MFFICFAVDVAHDRVSHRTSLNRVSVVNNNLTFLTECLQSSYNINMLENVSHKFECSDTVIIESVGPVVGYLCLQLATHRCTVCIRISCRLSPTLYSAVERPCFVSPRRQERCGIYSRPGNRYYFLPLSTI